MKRNSSNSGRLKGVYLRGKRFWFRYNLGGHQHRVPLDTDDEGTALTKALKIRENPLLAGADPLKEEIDNYLTEKQEEGIYTRNSADTRSSVLHMFASDRGLKEVRAIKEDEIDSWLKSLRKRKGKHKLEASSVDSYAMIVRSFCTWLVGRKKLRDNPAHFIKSKRMTSAKQRPFCRREQMDLLIDECPSRELKFILYAGFHGGMRKEEIVQARRGWFDLSLNIIHIVESDDWKPKDKDKRTIPLSKRFRDFLANEFSIERTKPGTFLVQPGKVQGKARYRYDFRKPFEAYVHSRNLAWLKPHVMRHTFASLLAIAGVSIFKIAKWLGDDVRVVERHYAHLLPQDPDVERAFGDVSKPIPREPGIDQAL